MANKFTDNGGPVIQIPRVQLIYWGSAWSSNPAPTPSSDQITGAVQSILAGPYMVNLQQYRNLGRGHLLGATVIGSSDPSNPFTDADVSNFISAQINNGTLPSLDGLNQNLYLVIMPVGVASSNTNEDGEHTYYPDNNGNRVHFGWVMNNGTLDYVTTIFSHELVESATDPEGSALTGVAGTCTGSGWCEIGDICESTTGVLSGVTVQSYWSNADAACTVPAWPPGTYPYSGVQWTDTLPANSTISYFTYNWPEYLFVEWEVVPTDASSGSPQISWQVQLERPNGAYITYWIVVTNLTGSDVGIEGRYSVLGV
jgi:hypothetical protein